jgi:hypothetical protein
MRLFTATNFVMAGLEPAIHPARVGAPKRLFHTRK